jgi:hypothetical protein
MPRSPTKHRTIACTGVRELAGFDMDNLSRVPGDACRSASEVALRLAG